MSKDVECPYCGAEIKICHDGRDGYEQDVLHEYECHHCEKKFVFQTFLSFSYIAYKANCLNDANHDYKLTHTYPLEDSKMRCSMCGDERDMTDVEHKHFGIGTNKEYFDNLIKEKK